MFLVRREYTDKSEEEIKTRELAITELGSLLAKTRQADGKLPCNVAFKIRKLVFNVHLKLHSILQISYILRKWSACIQVTFVSACLISVNKYWLIVFTAVACFKTYLITVTSDWSTGKLD